MAVLETECSFAKSRSSSSASSSSSDYLYAHIRFPTSYDVFAGAYHSLALVVGTNIMFQKTVGQSVSWRMLVASCSCYNISFG